MNRPPLDHLRGKAIGAAPASPSAAEDLCDHSAGELASLIRRREASAREVVAAHLARIERVNPSVNAVVTLVADRALADATRADEAVARGDRIGPLHGVPVVHKDLIETADIRTTFGSPFYRDNVPTQDALIVARARAAGAITLGKSNTPEFGAGSQTFNTIFGATRNPYDLTKTCGGSSGGSTVALACGMTPIATGTDFGGSLRNPAAFCNVVGLRPSPGRVPVTNGSWSPFSVSGPMARTVADAALFLSTIAGADSRDPLSIDTDPSAFAASLEGSVRGARVAWWRGLGGLPFEPDVRRVVDANRAVFEELGCIVEEDEPDFSGVDEALPTLRHLSNSASYAALARQRPEWIKDTIRWEIAEAERMTGADVARAMNRQALMYQQTHDFFQRHDFFVLPVTQVMPFDITTPYPTSVAGVAMPTYIDWMRSCWYVSFMSSPAISVPGGFANGLPVGLQIVGPHRGEWSLLRLAHAFEQATRFGELRPKLAMATGAPTGGRLRG
ncbi:MAG: Amidase [Gemmatimonadetes bacterium]|nr:Amidase [Gemmatimonadota bacterium]